MSNLTVRILVALGTIPLIVYLSMVGGFPFYGMILFISLLGLHEFYLLAEKKSASPQIATGLAFGFTVTSTFMFPRILGMLGIAVPPGVWPLLLSLLIFVPLVMVIELFRNRGSAIVNTSVTLLGVCYVSLFLGSIIGVREMFASETFPAWRFFDVPRGEFPGEVAEKVDMWGGATLITVFASIWFCDSLAYFAGRFLGKHKLFERVSPKKTWEGASAGYVGAVAVFLVSQNYFLPYMSVGNAFVCGSIVGVFGQLGDLAESLLKRDAGVKDSSALIPGHGGVLDRFDSLIFVSPLLYVYLRFIFS